MKHQYLLIPTLATALALAVPGYGQVLVNDTWADGSRSEQGLPDESEWFAASSGTLTAAPGAMTGTVGTGSSMWMTYYTPLSIPATLGNVGDSLKATLVFTPNTVATAPTTSRGFRVGLYDYSASTRVDADGFSTSGANGDGVTGYMLNMNFAQSFTINNPMQIMKRNNVGSLNLMGATGDYASLGTGGGSSGDPGFAGGTQYTFEFILTRTGPDSLEITTTFLGNAAPISHTVTDVSSANFSFDALAIRPGNAASSAEEFVFSNFKVELIPIPEPSTYALAGLSLLGLAGWRRWVRR